MEWIIFAVFLAGLFFWFRRKRARPAVFFERPENSFVIGVAGESHDNADGSSRQRIIAKLAEGELVGLFAELDNPYDSTAVAVVSRFGQIGYLPAGRCVDIFERLEAGENVPVGVDKILGGTRSKPSFGVTIWVHR